MIDRDLNIPRSNTIIILQITDNYNRDVFVSHGNNVKFVYMLLHKSGVNLFPDCSCFTGDNEQFCVWFC